MAKENQIASSEVFIDAGTAEVWKALTNAEMIRTYMFGTTVTSDWTEGSSITWKGEWQGKTYEDHGKVIRSVPGQLLIYSHSSGSAGTEEAHTVTIKLNPHDEGTKLMLTQDGSASEESKKHAEQNWNRMLQGLKKVVEGGGE